MDNGETVFQNPGFQQQEMTPPQNYKQEKENLPPASFYKPNGNGSSVIKKILKIFIGLFVLILIAAVINFVVLPKLSNPSGQVTLTYWGLWEDQKTMQGTISDFERQYPNIKIDYVQQDIKQYGDRLITRINNGTGPDIFRFHNSWVPMLSGILLPIPTNIISKDEFTSSFYPVAQKDLIKNGAILGIPLEIDTLALYINTQEFQNAGLTPPTNWNEFVNDARALTVKDQNNKITTAGAAMGTYDNINHAPDILSLLFLQNSADIYNLEGSKDRVDGALSFYTSFATDQNNVWDNTLDPSILAFAKGNLAMYFGYSWDYFTIKQFNPNLSFQIVPVPQLPDQNTTLASYWVEGVSQKSKHQQEALLFLKFLAQKSTEQTLYADESKERAFGEPYARVDLADTLKANPSVYPFVEQAKYAGSSYLVDGTFDNALNQETDTYLENAVNSVVGGSSTETAFDTFQKGVSQVLQKYGL